jgi:hypothetical protein
VSTETTASVQIEEPPSSTVSRHYYKLVLKDAAGSPLAGKDIVITVEGDGSFAHNFLSNEIRRETDDNGEAQFTWFRRSVYLRTARARVTASYAGEGSLTLEELEEAPPGVSISWKPDEIRIPPRRV